MRTRLPLILGILAVLGSALNHFKIKIRNRQPYDTTCFFKHGTQEFSRCGGDFEHVGYWRTGNQLSSNSMYQAAAQHFGPTTENGLSQLCCKPKPPPMATCSNPVPHLAFVQGYTSAKEADVECSATIGITQGTTEISSDSTNTEVSVTAGGSVSVESVFELSTSLTALTGRTFEKSFEDAKTRTEDSTMKMTTKKAANEHLFCMQAVAVCGDVRWKLNYLHAEVVLLNETSALRRDASYSIADIACSASCKHGWPIATCCLDYGYSNGSCSDGRATCTGYGKSAGAATDVGSDAKSELNSTEADGCPKGSCLDASGSCCGPKHKIWLLGMGNSSRVEQLERMSLQMELGNHSSKSNDDLFNTGTQNYCLLVGPYSWAKGLGWCKREEYRLPIYEKTTVSFVRTWKRFGFFMNGALSSFPSQFSDVDKTKFIGSSVTALSVMPCNESYDEQSAVYLPTINGGQVGKFTSKLFQSPRSVVVPFTGLKLGDTIRIEATPTAWKNNFVINLWSKYELKPSNFRLFTPSITDGLDYLWKLGGLAIKQPSFIALHINPRFKENQIVFNSYINKWSAQEAYSKYPFTENERFAMLIVRREDTTEIIINEVSIYQYKNRCDMDDVDRIEIYGDLDIHMVDFSFADGN